MPSRAPPLSPRRARGRPWGGHYNEAMIVVRYAALAMLVLWLATMVAALEMPVGAGTIVKAAFDYTAGGIILACFVMMKLIGPPPAAFFPRAGIVLLMLGLSFYAHVSAGPATRLIAWGDVALGFALLFWYVRE